MRVPDSRPSLAQSSFVLHVFIGILKIAGFKVGLYLYCMSYLHFDPCHAAWFSQYSDSVMG
jgi:hypothetical protein